MFSWMVAGLPAAAFLGVTAFACALPLLGPAGGGVGALGVAVLAWTLWTLALPRWSAGKLLEGLKLETDPLLSQSWERAFDGRDKRWSHPRIFLWRTPVPCLLAWRFGPSSPVLLVSEGWISLRGEAAFREACIRADAAWSAPDLPARTRAAFSLSLISALVPRGFWALGDLSASGVSAVADLSPLGMVRASIFQIGLRWIMRCTSRPGDAPSPWPSRPGSSQLTPDWVGRLEPGLAPWAMLLSLEHEASRRIGSKSMLSWLPASRELR